MKKGVLKTFANLTGKHLCWSLFLIKLQAFGLFTEKFAKFLRTAILKNIYERLLQRSGISLNFTDLKFI